MPAHWLSRWRGLFLFGIPFFLGLLILLLAVGNIWLIHQVRHLETNYYTELKSQQRLKAEWGKLMLEQSHLIAPARIQQIAEKQLHLKLEKTPSLHNFQTIYLPKVEKVP